MIDFKQRHCKNIKRKRYVYLKNALRSYLMLRKTVMKNRYMHNIFGLRFFKLS